MAPKQKIKEIPIFVREWSLSAATTLGSSVRAKGILLEMRAKLPLAARRSLDVRSSVLVLAMPENAQSEFETAAAIIDKHLTGIESLPVIPREIQDILSITTTERHRWLKDGRLPSAGTRTVKLRGRARKITFHVFDPRKIEDVLDQDLVSAWREDDAATAAENRRQAAWKRKLARQQHAVGTPETVSGHDDQARPGLVGWEEFERTGLLR